MAREFCIVAEIEATSEYRRVPCVGDSLLTLAGLITDGALVGTITEVKPMMTADDALGEIMAQMHTTRSDAFITIVQGIIGRYRASAGPQ